MKNKKVLLLAAVLLIAVQGVSFAQLDLKAKAVETLTNGVMKELEKKFTEILSKETISAAVKKNVVSKLSEISRPIVKNFIDNATTGKLPNAAELVNKVLNDVVPRVPEIVAASLAEGDVPDVKTALTGAAPPTGQMTTAVNASLSNVPGYDDEKEFTVEVIDGGSAARITKYNGKNTEIRIPPRIGNSTVTEIGDRVFTKKGLTSVIIPESVIFIGNMAFADNQISSVSIGSNVYVANNAFDGSGNFSFAGFYNSQGRKAGTYGISWRIVSAVAPQSVSATQTTTQQPAASATKVADGSWGAFSIKLVDNFYDLKNKRLFNGSRVVSGEKYTLKITYTATRDLENDLFIGLIDKEDPRWHRPLTWSNEIGMVRIPASKAGEEVSATITLNTIATASSISLNANMLTFYCESKGKKSLTLNITEFVFTKE